MNYNKSEAITFSVAGISVTVVIVSLIAAIYFGVGNENRRYYDAMQQCIEARGTWVPTRSAGACVMSNR